ncbi:cysteine hydrolase family protein [Leifsonia shinshuensis]|uniref:Cysteine hydrolase n=1 Tax=Leifsonia shinshuensis TaxID=150026 RepID=A0A7G6YA40_9MICO|nr:cysteine hydrolase family protein [Leifsonia shinshuensis]QNE35355.1 cysteine hydrolase [Leifsonia shinshuensis]
MTDSERSTPALIVIDIQRDYFPDGEMPLRAPLAAAEQARQLLNHFRSNNWPVIHIKHVWDSPEATYLRPGTPGIEHHPLVAPLDEEEVVVKEFPNAFLETRLSTVLEVLHPSALVICGMMSNMCVDATVRAAADFGYNVTVAHDACDSSNLQFNDRSVDAADVHAAYMASLADGYAAVRSVSEILALY